MAVEIERKFLVAGDGWRAAVLSETRILQGYLVNQATATVRARVAGERAYLTIKGPGNGLSRSEYEYPIPVADAEAMLGELAVSPPIEKTRYRVRAGDHVWDLDVFAGANAGLVMAEVELAAEDEVFARPDWLGEEVTGDPRYYNVNLARCPYLSW
ncbi:CYTH domain-containing protein [Thiococcus pfennigii]|jgi:adenylate cyclase|uniref:CYTH domain-containing protein n=1 Tax=Thiococcus pfennigii TaxID=1057 RepID=UPI0019058AE3|nr:CYTH domain-containing protein [Thiococcus pfennigii]MBK1702709.1 adenylate cyclase [Thiococcus pfennigii]MBK1732046.1 adenylate cyclase [Thiococcus pfennigii]